MKRILNLIYIPMLAMGLAGCEDFLTVTVPDQFASDNYWTSEAEVESAVSAVYSQLYLGGGWRFHENKFIPEPFREDIILMGKGAGDTYMPEMYNFTFNMSSQLPASLWNYSYWGLSYCNQVIEKAGKMDVSLFADPKTRDQLVGEAYFMRGYYHMFLLMNFEQIIIRDTYIYSEADIDKPLSSREAAWDVIVKDFAQAAKTLPISRDDEKKGRATSASANAYLGYAYLTRAYEETARKAEFLAAAEEALKPANFTGYTLVSMADWAGMFDGSKENSSESLLEIQFTATTSGGAAYSHQLQVWIAPEEMGGWEGLLPSQMLVDEFKKEGKTATTGTYDSRMFGTLYFQDPYFNDGNKKVLGADYDDWFEGANKYVFRKYVPNDLNLMETQKGFFNIMLMRYANVLLMRAEVYNEQNHSELAIPLINEVRHRADMPDMTGTSQADVKAQIEHERIVEFALESYRFYDLRRWGKAKEALAAVGRTTFDPAKNNFYYLPEGEINSNTAIK